jgi:hypothetical protein
MAFSEIFNISFLFAFAISILIISAIFAYLNYRFAQQDHKMSSMLGLISTMAQEVDFFRSKYNKTEGGSPIIITPFSNENDNELIEVSDDDEDEDEDEDDDDEDEDDDEDDIIDNNLDDKESTKKDNTIKILNINLGNSQKNLESDLDISNEINELNNDHYNSDDDSQPSQPSFGSQTVCFNSGPEKIKLDDKLDFFKSIHISDLDEPIDGDYKKMPVNKLRLLVVEKGLCEDASKMKKPEILKLMESI